MSLQPSSEFFDRILRELLVAWPTCRRFLAQLDEYFTACSDSVTILKTPAPKVVDLPMASDPDSRDEIEALLNAEQEKGRRQARARRSNNPSDIDIHTIEREHRDEVFEQFKKCQHLLTPPQWEVVVLHYGRGMNLTQIALSLGKRVSTISGFRKRALKHKAEFDEQERRKFLDAMRNLRNSRE